MGSCRFDWIGSLSELCSTGRSSLLEKIGDLQKLAVILTDMAAQCDDGALPEGPIIDALREANERSAP
jgi:hypothetical protein